MKVLPIVLLATVCASCMSVDRESIVFVPAPKLTSCILKADASAEQVIAKHNQSESSSASLPGGHRKLSLDEYEKTVGLDRSSGREYVCVMFKLKEPLPGFGHPDHFSVWIYIDNEEAIVHGGR